MVLRRRIRLALVHHRSSDLVAVYSDDLPGLLVTARTPAELTSRLPAALLELLEPEGYRHVKIEVGDAGNVPPDFIAFPTAATVTANAA